MGVIVTALTSYGYLEYCEAPESLPMSLNLLVVAGVLSVLMSAFIIALFYLCGTFAPNALSHLVYLGAYSSFAVYLFHRPVFQITKTALGRDANLTVSSLAICVTIAFLFVASYGVQRLCDYVTSLLEKPAVPGTTITTSECT